MKIAFYAPLKAPDHPVPSGDRQMARLLMKALAHSGHEVFLVSRLRTYLRDPTEETYASALASSLTEQARIAREWMANGPADLWFTYHPYYRAPDLLGPQLCEEFKTPYVTCEASYAPKRDRDEWKDRQALAKRTLRRAALNICFTDRDRAGIAPIVDEVTLADVEPFTDISGILPRNSAVETPPGNLITVAMMRAGDKFESFRMLAASLRLIGDAPWHLTVIGHGPLAGEVRELFAQMEPGRVAWKGELPPQDIPPLLARASIYVWPGCGEAYGMAYLEAQASGLPVIAQNTAGVPSVVHNGKTGILVKEGDVEGLASALRRWIADPGERWRYGQQARDFIRRERSLEQAAARLDRLLAERIDGRSLVAG
jgi:glycosyltransferase involved in cell wall biosynthesis